MTDLNQTWTATDLQSVTNDCKKGGLVIIFHNPFKNGLAVSTEDLITDVAGSLTSVMSEWIDSPVSEDFTTNGSAPHSLGFLLG